MPRPLVIPAWATDANFPAGTDPWSGTPTKSEPSAGKKGTGFVPDTDQAAEETNFVINNVAQFASYEDSAISGTGFTIIDDFTGDTLNQGIWKAPTGTVALADDSANNAMGAIKIDATAITGFIMTQPLAVLTDEFRVSIIIRDTSAGGGNISAVGLTGPAAANRCHFVQNNANASPANWYAQVGAGVAVDTGVAVTAVYQKLEIIRASGIVYFKINGVTVYSVAFATSEPASTLTISNVMVVGSGILWIDVAKLWIDR